GWIKQRYPGTRPWFARLGEVDGMRPMQARMPLCVWFCVESAREELIGWRPATQVGPLPVPLADALDRTRAARRRYAATVPSPALRPAPDLVELAHRYRATAAPRLEKTETLAPQPWEQAALISTVEAMDIAVHEILPATVGLLDLDVDRLGRFLERDEKQEA